MFFNSQFTQVQLWNSPAYRKAIAGRDTFGFVCIVWLHGVVLFCSVAWYGVMHNTMRSILLIGLLYALMLRTLEYKRPILYRTWRTTLLRIERLYQLTVTTGDCLQLANLFHQGRMEPTQLQAAFSFKPLQKLGLGAPLQLFLSIRALCSTCIVMSLAGVRRVLPFHEHVVVQAYYLIMLLVCNAPIATSALQQPAFQEGNTLLCKLLSAVPDCDHFFPGACGSKAPARLVLFIHIFLMFLLPVYINFQRDYRLMAAVDLEELVRRAQLNGAEVEVVPYSMWSDVGLDVVILTYMALVTWCVLLHYDQQVLEWVEGVRKVVLPVALPWQGVLALNAIRF